MRLHISKTQFARAFSTSNVPASDTEGDFAKQEIRPKIEPLKKQVTDFLKNVNQYEDEVKDTISPYYFSSSKLKGFATEQGTDQYYRKSQYDDLNLEVHPDNFKILY